MSKYPYIVIFFCLSLFVGSCQENIDVEDPLETIQEIPTENIEDVFAADYWDDAELIWSDEFDGTEISRENWKFETGNHGWGNNELQNYIDGNVEVSDGTLKIIAKKEVIEGSNYSSARLNSIKQFTFGKIEIRAKIPELKGNGIWPALWMLGNDINTIGWPACGEIDIMEYVSYSPNEFHFTVHSTANNHVKGTQITSGPIPLQTIEEEFHTYGVLWTDKYIKFYLDTEDNIKLTFLRPSISNSDNWPFSKPYYFLMNIAVGGNWGGAEGVANNIFPAVMEVDYVRVYQK